MYQRIQTSGIEIEMSVDQTNQHTQETRISGIKVVVAMFSLAIVATSILWFYWNLHLMPFMPLQEVLAKEFPESSPRVDGGRRKTHKGTPMILRIVMRVPFDPTSSNADVQTQIEQRMMRIQELAVKYADLEKYEQLDIHMYNEPQEKALLQKTFHKDMKTDTEAGTSG